MKLLPTEQTKAQQSALRAFLENGRLTLSEPCDCGSQIRHNNGGNYHQTVDLRMDAGRVFRSRTTTSDYDSGGDWREVTFTEAVEEIARLSALDYYAR